MLSGRGRVHLSAISLVVCVDMIRLVSSPLLLAILLHLVAFASSQRVVVENPTRARALFNLNGVTGWIGFYENKTSTSIMVNLQGLEQPVSEWSIRELPADNTLSPSIRCSEDYLGGVYNTTNMVMGDAAGDLSGRYKTTWSCTLYCTLVNVAC